MSPRVMLRAAAAALLACAVAADPLASFQAPVPGVFASGGDLQPAIPVATPDACAAACLALGPGCVSMHVCTNGTGGLACGVSGWSMAYTAVAAPTCTWYRRTTPRNDTAIAQAVPWALIVPTRGVALTGPGPLAATFTTNVDTYLKVRDPLDMLFFFAQRAGVANPPGQCFGWGEWIKGSEAGNYLMGAGNALRFLNDSALAANVAAVVQGIAGYADPVTGWLWAFNESAIGDDNLPDYCASWVTRGLLAADMAGVPGALALARQSLSLFANHTSLPFFLPPNGGPDPVQPYPSGFNNQSSGG